MSAHHFNESAERALFNALHEKDQILSRLDNLK